MELLTQPVTADNFLEVASLPEYADCLVELIEGEIVTMGLNNGMHGEIVIEIGRVLGNFVKPRGLGRVTGADAAFVLERTPDGRDTVRGLDVAFISFERFPEPLPQTIIDAVPELAVEIMSPSNTVPDIRLKVRQLLEAGTQAVWIVHPDFHEVDVHTADGAITYREGDSISGGDILPGFELAVADIFPR